MTKQQYALKAGGKPRLELEWGSYMRDFRVRFDGEEIGRIDTGKRSLREAHTFPLPDGSKLSIRLAESGLTEELELLRDGEPLPGSAADPFTKFSAAIRNCFSWGVVLLFAGLLAMLTRANIFPAFGFTSVSIVFGLVLLVLAYGMSRRLIIAATLAGIIVAVEFILLLLNVETFNIATTIAIVLRVAFAVPIVQGIRPMRSL